MLISGQLYKCIRGHHYLFCKLKKNEVGPFILSEKDIVMFLSEELIKKFETCAYVQQIFLLKNKFIVICCYTNGRYYLDPQQFLKKIE